MAWGPVFISSRYKRKTIHSNRLTCSLKKYPKKMQIKEGLYAHDSEYISMLLHGQEQIKTKKEML